MKKVVMRKCVVTKEVLPRDNLLKIVLTPEKEVKIDFAYRLNGHGAYLKKDPEVVKKAQKTKALDKALEAEVPDKIYEDMLVWLSAKDYESK